MTRHAPTLFLILALASAGANAQKMEAAGDEITGRAARAIAIVPPDYPKGAAARNATAVVDVRGRVHLNGTFAVVSMTVTPDDPEFRAAVEAVARHWLFWPQVDGSTCESSEVDAGLRVYFEIEGGEPRVKISYPLEARRTESRKSALAAGYRPEITEKVIPVFPQGAIRAGIRGASVLALVRVESDGHVSKVSAAPTYAHVSFLVAARRALEQWKFKVGPEDLKPGESFCALVPIEYKLSD